MPIIKPSVAIRQNYNEISQLCKETREPVYLTKNGEGDLVVMDKDAFEELVGRLKIKVMLLEQSIQYEHGELKTYSFEECMEKFRQTIEEARNGRKEEN